MKQLRIMMLSKKKIRRNLINFTISSIGIYILISLYFINHFYFHTVINGVNVSLKSHDDSTDIINNFIKKYELQLIDRNGETDIITSQDIDMKYNKHSTISQVYHNQAPLQWFGSLFHTNQFYTKELYDYSNALLDRRLDELEFFKGKIVEPQNVKFKFNNGSYEIVKEVYGNNVNKKFFANVVKKYISEGRKKLDLNESFKRLPVKR